MHLTCGPLFCRAMPFLGQDWRSPGWSWVKTDDGWKRCEPWREDLDPERAQRSGPHGMYAQPPAHFPLQPPHSPPLALGGELPAQRPVGGRS